jgi:hypothetical protein
MANLDFSFMGAQELMYNKEILTPEERDLCMQFWPAMAKEYLFYNEWRNDYLNLYVYSEVEHHELEFRKELGQLAKEDREYDERQWLQDLHDELAGEE